jgi:hypothetical protein
VFGQHQLASLTKSITVCILLLSMVILPHTIRTITATGILNTNDIVVYSITVLNVLLNRLGVTTITLSMPMLTL